MSAEESIHLRQWFQKGKNRKRILFFCLILAGLFVAARLVDINEYLHLIRKWIWEFGSWGTVVYVAFYTGATLMFLPGTPFTILAAFLFGDVEGFLTMVAATTVSATVAFLSARYIARGTIEKRITKIEEFEKFKRIMEENYWFTIPFVRLMPFFPFSFNNYALGLIRIPFWKYLLVSELVFIPMNAIMVFGATTLYSAVTGGEISWWIAGGSLAGGFAVLVLGYVCKRKFGNGPGHKKRA